MAYAKLISSYDRQGISEKTGKPWAFYTAIMALDGMIISASTDEFVYSTLKDKVGKKFRLYKHNTVREGLLTCGDYLGEEKIKKQK